MDPDTPASRMRDLLTALEVERHTHTPDRIAPARRTPEPVPGRDRSDPAAEYARAVAEAAAAGDTLATGWARRRLLDAECQRRPVVDGRAGAA
jgi:hypothetical protein